MADAKQTLGLMEWLFWKQKHEQNPTDAQAKRMYHRGRKIPCDVCKGDDRG